MRIVNIPPIIGARQNPANAMYSLSLLEVGSTLTLIKNSPGTAISF